MEISNKKRTSPLKEKLCPCGCDETFFPKRKDQIYKNTRHSNFAYNHGKRKEKSRNQRSTESKLQKNDKILEKYYQLFKEDLFVVFSLNLISDGFDHSLFTGNDLKEGLLYRKTYNYLFHEYEKDNRKLTRIIKQKRKVYVKR